MNISIMCMVREVTVPATEHNEEHVVESEEVNGRSQTEMQGVRGELSKSDRMF